jgi:16S rRNA (cytosine1402-N4)-methyltransferase
VYADFAKSYEVIQAKNLLGKIDGILLDLGVSSPQLDDETRGFSFMVDNYLDMRMDNKQKLDAKKWLESNDEKTIADVLYKYGEEKKSRQIARKIKEFQKTKALTTTKELSDIVKSVVKVQNKNPATRTFQAIRIAVNNEFSSLENLLNSSYEILKTNGVLSIISFHSLEDRIVKNFIKTNSQMPNIPKNLPIIDFKPKFKQLKKIKPSTQEIAENPRSRSAMLRGAIKC